MWVSITMEKMKVGYIPGQSNQRNSAPRKPGDNHYFEVNPEYEDRDRSRKRGTAPEELEKELIRREKEIAMIKQAERDFDRQYKITSNRDQPLGGSRGSSKPYEQPLQATKPHQYSEHKMQPPWGTGPLPRVSEPRTIPNHSTGGNPGRLAHTFSGFDGPLQPVQPPARMAAITSLPGQFQTPVSATQQSSGNLGNKKTTPFSRELNTLDSQIDKTEAEIQRIRQNIESLQTQFRDQKS